ncbi:MAG: DUF5658 family protein [Armatimonadota bacterium]|nr:MAG: hypothetical protein KatS3mg024_2389 [Armatimonadota bacterium]
MRNERANVKALEVGDIRGLCPESVMLVLICVADAVSTLFLVGRGLATEANPLMAWCLERGALVFLTVKAASFAPFVAMCEIYRRRNPVTGRLFIRVGFWAYLLAYLLLVLVVNLRPL